MGQKLTAGEETALTLWAAWITTPAGERAKIEAWARWHVRELVRHLEAVAHAKGRAVDVPEPLLFADLLRLLEELDIAPADFFGEVIARWNDGQDAMTERAPRRKLETTTSGRAT